MLYCYIRLIYWWSWVGMKTLVLCSVYDVPTLFQNLHKRSLACRENGTLQTSYPLWFMVRLSVLWPDIPPLSRGLPPIHHPKHTYWAALWVWALGIRQYFFPYCKPTIPHWEGSPYSPPKTRWVALCVSPVTLCQYPDDFSVWIFIN